MKRLLLLSGLFLFLFSCTKEESSINYTYTYKLAGTYSRDTAIKSDGHKQLHLRDDGSYCWTRVINGKDSTFCLGKYIQTSDTSMLWEGETVVNFKIIPLDTIAKGMYLELVSSPPAPPLFGYYK